MAEDADVDIQPITRADFVPAKVFRSRSMNTRPGERCTVHVGRNKYVPLFGVDSIECRLTRYYVIRDVIAI